MRKLILVLGITTLAAGYVSAHMWQQLRIERERTESLQARVAELEKARPAPAPRPPMPHPFELPRENPFQSLPTNESPPPAANAPARPPAPSLSPDPRKPAAHPSSALRASSAFIGRQALMNDPEYREAMRAQQRMMLPQSYPDLGKELNLTPQEREALFDLLVDHRFDMMDRAVYAPGPGVPPDEAALGEMQRKAQEARRRQEGEIAALLGDVKYQQWKEYQQTMPARHQVNNLRTVLQSAGYPLRDDQVRPLIGAVAAEQKRQIGAVTDAGAPFQTQKMNAPVQQLQRMEEHLTRIEENNRRLRDAVAPYLSTQQLEQFEQMQEQNLNMQRIHLRMQRAQFDAQGSSEASGMEMVAPGGGAMIVTSP